MKQILFLIVVVVIAFIIYCMVTGDSETSPRPSSLTQPTVSPAPVPAEMPRAPMNPVSTPQRVVQQTPPVVVQRPVAPPPPPPPAVDPRAAEVRQIIYACAKRARWTIVDYRPTGMGIVRVTGRAPNDNIANQRFLDEVQRSGILRDIENGPARAFQDNRGRSILECSFIIKWQ
jgi:type IV secretory pathway VirB10-like protein